MALLCLSVSKIVSGTLRPAGIAEKRGGLCGFLLMMEMWKWVVTVRFPSGHCGIGYSRNLELLLQSIIRKLWIRVGEGLWWHWDSKKNLELLFSKLHDQKVLD
jgi:hypothetical protein